MPRLSWKRDPRQRWTFGRELGWHLNYGEHKNIAWVSRNSNGFEEGAGYHWGAHCDEIGVPFYNSAAARLAPLPTAEDAKATALAYVKAHVRQAEEVPNANS